MIKVCLIDYGGGNLKSVYNALDNIETDIDLIIGTNQHQIQNCDKIIIPGQGSSQYVMKKLEETKLINTLKEEILEKKKEVLGICVGMQIMFKNLTEDGNHLGLNFFDGKVIKLQNTQTFKVPNIGWYNVQFENEEINKKIKKKHYFHCHSYHCVFEKKFQFSTTQNQKLSLQTGILYENICGVQFHPEKSQEAGLRFLDWFIKK